MLRFTLVSQNEEFASHLGAFLFGNSIRQQKREYQICLGVKVLLKQERMEGESSYFCE